MHCRRRSTRDRGAAAVQAGPGAMIVAPPSAHNSPWSRKFEPASTGDGVRLDARPRGAAPASGRPRVRPVRPRRLARPAYGGEGAGAEQVWVTHGFIAPVVRWFREQGLDAHGMQNRVRGRVRRAGGRGVKAFADLYAALDATTKTTEKVDALARYFAAASAADARLGRLLPVRPQAPPGGPDAEAPGVGRRASPASPSGCSTRATTPSATWPRRSPCCSRTPTRPRDRPLSDWVEQVLLPLRDAGEERQKAEVLAAWAVAGRPAGVRLEQADHRRVPRRRVAAPGHAGAQPGERRAGRSHRPPADGRLAADAAFFARSCRPDAADADVSRPYPFFLAHPLDGPPERWATSPSGRPSGSGTASARS